MTNSSNEIFTIVEMENNNFPGRSQQRLTLAPRSKLVSVPYHLKGQIQHLHGPLGPCTVQYFIIYARGISTNQLYFLAENGTLFERGLRKGFSRVSIRRHLEAV